MAKLRRPLNSDKARGALGGVIFSESNNVNYARRNTIKPYEHTVKRKEAASRLSASATAWASLSESDKEAWRAFAETTKRENAFGEQVTIPAFSWFCSCRENLQSVLVNDNPRIAEMVFPPVPQSVAVAKLTSGANWRLRLSINAGELVLDNRFRVYRSKKPSTSAIYNISDCEYWKPNTTNPSGNFYIMSKEEYEKFKGTYTVYIQTINRSSGLASDYFKALITLPD